MVLFGCTSSEPRRETPEQMAAIQRVLAQDPEFGAAKLFDDYLFDRLEAPRRAQFEADCAATPEISVFCFSVLNRERLVAKTKERDREMSHGRRRRTTVHPRFNAKNELMNWKEIKGATVASLLRGLPKNSTPKMTALKMAALREMECPNTPAIAVAALLEDRLPEKADFEEIGRLYEKGAACVVNSPTDKETMYTRAGLMYFAKGKYSESAASLKSASEVPGVFIGRALYWLFRAQTKLEKSEARETLETLHAKYPFSFHSLVAQTATGKDPGELLARTAPPPTTRSRQDPEVNLLLEQVEILNRLEFNAAASRVLNWAVALGKGVEPEVMLYMAELKKGENEYTSKIYLLSDVLYKNPSLVSRQSLELYFPKVLFPVFEKQSEVIDPYFLLAVARRESAFNPRAVSTANARGLLQVLPKTGRKIMKKPNLFDPATNVEVGAKYFANLLQRVDGNVHYALAAYNAGPQKLQAWTKTYPVDDPVLFIDMIPFRETREYVGSVLRNYYWYRRIHQADKPIPADKLLDIATGGQG